MKIALLGKSGQVGWELHPRLAKLGDVKAAGGLDISQLREAGVQFPSDLAALAKQGNLHAKTSASASILPVWSLAERTYGVPTSGH